MKIQTTTQIYTVKLMLPLMLLLILKRVCSKKVITNQFSEEIFIENLASEEYFIIYDFLGQKVIEGKYSGNVKIPETDSISFEFNQYHNLQVD